MAMKKRFPYRAALVACNGDCGETQLCEYGCLGCRKCMEACRFGAISINDHGVAVVDENVCIACGKCVKTCPQQIIHIHQCANTIVVKCSNKQKGKEAREVCQRSCIGCGICEKTCTAEAIRVQENCAVIDEDACLSCGMCAVKCPRGVIRDLRELLNP